MVAGILIQLLSPQDGVSKNLAAGKLNAPPCWKSPGQAGYTDIDSTQERGDIQGCTVPFHIGISGHDQFLDRTLSDSMDKRIYRQVTGFDSFQRRFYLKTK